MRIFISLVFPIFLIGCSQNPVGPPSVPLNQLLASPDTITVDGTQLYLTTYLHRDFMPISPPDGNPLVANSYVSATDTINVNRLISTDAIWVVYQGQVWKSWLTTPAAPTDPQWAKSVTGIARDGPKWGPDVRVDAVVRVSDSKGETYLLRASDQWIGRTD